MGHIEGMSGRLSRPYLRFCSTLLSIQSYPYVPTSSLIFRYHSLYYADSSTPEVTS